MKLDILKREYLLDIIEPFLNCSKLLTLSSISLSSKVLLNVYTLMCVCVCVCERERENTLNADNGPMFGCIKLK